PIPAAAIQHPAPVAPAPARSEDLVRDTLAARLELEIEAKPAPRPVVEAPAPITQTVADPAVTIQRYEPAQPKYVHKDPIQEIEQPMAPREPQIDRTPYVPPTAERPVAQTRVPRIDEFPPIAQRQMAQAEEHVDESRARSLLKRLAHGLGGRRDEADEAPMAREPSFREPAPAREGAYRPAGHDEFAKRPVAPRQAEPMHRAAAGQLDPHGRPAAVSRVADEDNLEIPAFLRRQSN
ncbi:MAG: hypothetical protein GX458_06100, partial [Phyllobacteriaceae bacterium]|nr:hypothetical protein [Phyllobacteriaceae bacterium]